MSRIELKNVSKQYENGFEAVKNFQLTIEDKEFVIFVGPSGCGKSTMLRMIAGLEEISEGELYIDGVKMNDVSAKDRDIAMVFQNYALYPHMTVRKNIAYSLKIHHVKKNVIEEKVMEAAKILGLEEVLDRKPGQLSGGQKQRVAMGRAIVRNPKVFLMDEPLSNLDAKLRGQMRVEIARLYHKLNATFIYVTHDQTEAMTLGTRIVVMKDGVIQQIDTPQNLFRYPVNQFVAGFIGTPPMNFEDVVIAKKDGRLCLKKGACFISLPEKAEEKLQGYAGETAVMGIRPEYVHVSREKTQDIHGTGTVDVYELLGSDAIAYITQEESGETLVAKIDTTEAICQGARVFISYETDRIHLFDKAIGVTLINECAV